MRVLKVRVTDRALSGCRLDKYLADGLRLFSRSQARERVVRVLVNGRESKLSRRVKQGDELEISYTAPPPVDVKPERLDLDVLYEDDQVIVLNKSQGMVVHPGSGNYTGTLVSGLLYRLRYRSVPALPGGPLRPGIVHRLDKDTSGVLIAAKTPAAHAFLAEQFKARRVKKTYLAIVKGSLREKQGKVVTGITRDIRDRKRRDRIQTRYGANPSDPDSRSVSRLSRPGGSDLWPDGSPVQGCNPHAPCLEAQPDPPRRVRRRRGVQYFPSPHSFEVQKNPVRSGPQETLNLVSCLYNLL
jgi:23S rRNA-/tRNA-specific pseudouridylate synthase